MLGYLTSNLNQDLMCQQSAIELILKKLRFDPIDAPRIPVFHHHQALRSSPISLLRKSSSVIVWFMRKASAKAWEKMECQTPSRFMDPKKGLRQSRICLHVCNCCNSISRNNLKLRGRKPYRKDCMLDKSLQFKIVMSFFVELVSPLFLPEYQENWIHAHIHPKRTNFPQQLIFQQDMSLMYTTHGSWVCKTCMAKTFIPTHNLWPESVSMPQVGFCMVGLRSKNHPVMHQPQPFQTSNCLALHAMRQGDECGQLIAWSKLHHSAQHVMTWFQSAPTTLFTIGAEASASASHCSEHATACLKHLKHLKPGHLATGTCCLQSHAPVLLALRHRCRAAAAGLTPCWFATPKPEPGQHGG